MASQAMVRVRSIGLCVCSTPLKARNSRVASRVPDHFYFNSSNPFAYGVGRGHGVGRGLGVGVGLIGVAVGVGVTVGVGVGVIGVGVGVGVGVIGVGVGVGVTVTVGVGVGVPWQLASHLPAFTTTCPNGPLPWPVPVESPT